MTERELRKWRDTRSKGALRYILTRTLSWGILSFVVDFLISSASKFRTFPNWSLI